MGSLAQRGLTQTEESYYSATKAAKLSGASETSDDVVLPYSQKEFQNWVKRVDIYDLHKKKADFYVDEDVVTKFTDYRNKVAAELPKYAEYDGTKLVGQLKNIGSCQDGSKVGKMNEADSLYVLDSKVINTEVKNTGTDGDYRIFCNQENLNCEVKPRRLRDQFAMGYEGVISKVPLPDCLQHAGFRSPAYSGLRYNGPAATSQFLSKNESILTWDITPTFCLGREHSTYQEVRAIIQPALEMNRETMFGDMGIHLIPDANEDIWRLSTAQLEADLLRELIPCLAPIRQALSNAKVLASEMKIWNAKYLTPSVCFDSGMVITEELDTYLETGEEELGERLKQKLRYAHIWIPPHKRIPYHEDEKVHASINTAAVKHILLNAALKNPEAFAGTEDKELVFKLMIIVFNTLGDPSQFSSPHAFLKGARIPHISVLSSQASNKMALALSIKEQCRILVSGAMTKPLAPTITDMDYFLHDINSCSLPLGKLICSEYCFHYCINPFQHPCLDRNIHHLTSILTALSNTCGGVVQLNAHDQTVLEESEFSLFKLRLLSLPEIHENLVELFQGGDNTSLAIIVAKRCQESLFCTFDNSCSKLWIDINGHLLQERYNEKGEGPEISKNPVDSLPDDETDDEVDDKVEMAQAPVELLTELNWGANKKNWDKILKDAKKSTDECIASCEVWEPRLPMQVTPDRDLLKYLDLFSSDAECLETLSKLETKTPGFAIARRSWASFLPDPTLLQRPPSHLCDILTVERGAGLESPQPNICLWVIVSSSTEQIIQRQVQYMFILGRTIKHQLSKQDRNAPNLAIQCKLHSTHAEDNVSIENALRRLGIQHMQKLIGSVFNDTDTFDGIKRCVALLLLSQESPIKTFAGSQMSVKFSEQQAKTFLNIKRRKVCYVSSAPGTGKTLCALAVYRDFGKERSVYISPTDPLLQYLRYNGCDAILVTNDEELSYEVKCGTFDNKVCVVIDESHHLRCSKASLRELFILMKKHQMRLFMFADNAYQSFEREIQEKIRTYIFELCEEVWGHRPYEPILNEIFRNTRKVVSFLQHAMEDPDSGREDITCGNAHEGDGIQCIVMGNLLDNHSDNDLVQYLRPLLNRYQVTDVAVLLDSGYADNDIDAVHQVLQSHLPRVTTQSSATFPRKGIVVDRVERFAGLDAALCIFLLSTESATNQNETIANPRYRVYLASRATHKAVFVVPRIDADVAKHLKFDHFPTPGHIYVMEDSPGRFKIGSSTDPKKQLKKGQIFNPDLKLVYIEHVHGISNMYRLEDKVQCALQRYCLATSESGSREWYGHGITLEQIIETIKRQA